MRFRLRPAELPMVCGILLSNTPESWLIGVSSMVRVFCAISSIEITICIYGGSQTSLQPIFDIITSFMLGQSVAEAPAVDWWSRT